MIFKLMVKGVWHNHVNIIHLKAKYLNVTHRCNQNLSKMCLLTKYSIWPILHYWSIGSAPFFKCAHDIFRIFQQQQMTKYCVSFWAWNVRRRNQ